MMGDFNTKVGGIIRDTRVVWEDMGWEPTKEIALRFCYGKRPDYHRNTVPAQIYPQGNTDISNKESEESD